MMMAIELTKRGDPEAGLELELELALEVITAVVIDAFPPLAKSDALTASESDNVTVAWSVDAIAVTWAVVRAVVPVIERIVESAAVSAVSINTSIRSELVPPAKIATPGRHTAVNKDRFWLNFKVLVNKPKNSK